MLKGDMHTHSEYSVDSKETINNMCIAAINARLYSLCITDHIDYNPNDYGFDFYKRDEYLKAIDYAKSTYKNDLIVLSGIEFSEPHIYPEKFMSFQQFDYDVVLGSIHWIGNEFVGQKELLESYSQEDVEKIYYDLVHKTIEYGKFDVMAHLDFPKRYYGSSRVDEKTVNKILKLMIQKNIALEINTSSFRKGLDESMPSIGIVESYIKLGGKRLTLGSDAHVATDVGSCFDYVLTKLSNDTKKSIGIFVDREFINLERKNNI